MGGLVAGKGYAVVSGMPQVRAYDMIVDAEAVRRLCVEIHGAVQGVGFRPFVYRLATALGLAGWVINDTRGVFVEVEGQEGVLAEFLRRLHREHPPHAIIQSLDTRWAEPAGYLGFEIRHSDPGGAKTVLVLPELATCDDCLQEVFDGQNRRYRYPFTNCTNCGPRFTIVEELPYDRPNTTMRIFPMCPSCRREYGDPWDRRFHAQPNACARCGPQLELWTPSHLSSPTGRSEQDWSTTARGDAALRGAAAEIRDGAIVAVKGLGGFHLMVDATNADAVARLRQRKARYEKPFAIMARDLVQVRGMCATRAPAEALLVMPETPIVLLPRLEAAPVAPNVAPDISRLGVMLPSTPLHHLLLADLDVPVVATSGNLSDEPICIDEQEAIVRLGGIADVFLVHNRPIARHVDDSVAAVIMEQPRLLRRARGYAPLPVLLPHEVPTILAAGPQLKNTVALSVGRQVFVSQHIGDLETPQAIAAFERVIADFVRLYDAVPLAVAHDLHPDYASTLWAREHASKDGPISLVPVQHHHAHLAACLAENGVVNPALGVTWDGTGYGADGTIWGGEFLLGDAAQFTRVAHLRPFLLPGGDVAARQPRRVAAALLWDLFGVAALDLDDLAPIRSFQPVERRLLARMLRQKVNTPTTTSAGRLFDVIAALAGVRQQVTFEGQAAMLLEAVADTGEQVAYPLPVVPGADGAAFVLDWRPLVEAVVADVRRSVVPAIIAGRFHNALVEAIVNIAHVVGCERVALTGGCFQNQLLVERAARRLEASGFTVLLHRAVPTGDGGISLGQVAVAAARLAPAQGMH